MHIWLRAETRHTERRTPLMPKGAAALIARGWKVTVERSATRVVHDTEYQEVGCTLTDAGSWGHAPQDAMILGIKELPDDLAVLSHHHIFFGHAYKGQATAPKLMQRLESGGGTLLDLEYLTDERGRRVAAFGYWAGYVGAAVSVLGYATARAGGICGTVAPFADQDALRHAAAEALGSVSASALIIGAQGRVGRGAGDLCKAIGIAVTEWDIEETAKGGPFLEILEHDFFFNAVLAGPNTPCFIGQEHIGQKRKLRMIGDIACDPQSPVNPIPLYTQETSWDQPVLRVVPSPVLDIMAIDNLPSLLPRESSEDFAAQLLPWLLELNRLDQGVWARARLQFDQNMCLVMEKEEVSR